MDAAAAAAASTADAAAAAAAAAPTAEHVVEQAVRSIVFIAEGECPLDDVCARLAGLGLDADRSVVKKARSKALRRWARSQAGGDRAAVHEAVREARARARGAPAVSRAAARGAATAAPPSPSLEQQAALADAEQFLTSNNAVLMRAHGFHPSVAEAARLTLASERLQRHLERDELEAAVAVWLEVEHGAGVLPTRLEYGRAVATIMGYAAAQAAAPTPRRAAPSGADLDEPAWLEEQFERMRVRAAAEAQRHNSDDSGSDGGE